MRDGLWSLRYLTQTHDFAEASQRGFARYPAFPNVEQTYTSGVAESLSTRVPTEQRSDFNAYLRHWFIDPQSRPTSFDVLGYSGGVLPRDTFRFMPNLGDAESLDLVTEIAGLRHQGLDTLPRVGDLVRLREEPSNHHDSQAVAFFSDADLLLGYVVRGLSQQVVKWVRKGGVEGEVVRANGIIDRPNLLVRIYATRRMSKLVRPVVAQQEIVRRKDAAEISYEVKSARSVELTNLEKIP